MQDMHNWNVQLLTAAEPPSSVWPQPLSPPRQVGGGPFLPSGLANAGAVVTGPFVGPLIPAGELRQQPAANFRQFDMVSPQAAGSRWQAAESSWQAAGILWQAAGKCR